jgi:hypothetical protein
MEEFLSDYVWNKRLEFIYRGESQWVKGKVRDFSRQIEDLKNCGYGFLSRQLNDESKVTSY